MAQTYNLTEGKVSRLILSFYFPMLFTNMLQQIYSIADTTIVGKGLGDNSLAAVGNMSSLTFLIIGFSGGLTNGFSVLIAQSYGAKKYEDLRKFIASAIKLAVIVSIILTLFSAVFLRKILVLLQTSPEIIDESLTYGYIIFGGLTATIAYNLCSGILRSLGDSKTPFIAIIISTAINISLDALLIFCFRTGVEGAAAATILAQVISTFICLLKLRKIDIIKLSKDDFKADMLMNSLLLKNGIPMALMNSITAVGCMVVQYFVNGLGVVYTSAYSACSKYINLFIQPACTAGFTMSSFTSQNFGAKKYGRIWEGLKVCLTIAFISYIILGATMILIPKTLAGFMLNGNEPIELTVKYLTICGFMKIAVDFLFVFRSGCQGMGFPFIPMTSGIVEMVTRISVIVFAINSLGFKATAFAEAAAWTSALTLNITAFIFLLRKTQKKNEQVHLQTD